MERPEATSTGGPTSSWTPSGGPPGVPPRRRLPDPSPQDVALRGVMQALVCTKPTMLADMVVAIQTSPLGQWCEGGSESVGVCCPAFAPSLNWLSCFLPKHKCTYQVPLAWPRHVTTLVTFRYGNMASVATIKVLQYQYVHHTYVPRGTDNVMYTCTYGTKMVPMVHVYVQI